jgi:hypothetical protein
MDKKLFIIGILSLTAVVLFVANLVMPTRAIADEVVKDRDWQVVTAHVQQNDEGLYILDNRSGMMAVFIYDPNAKSLVIRDRKPIMDAFVGAGKTR